MNNIAIKVENLSKVYQLGEIGTGTISRDLERWWAKLRGKEDPFLRIGETNNRSVKGTSDIVWSLKDLNFEIQQGDAVGIIGRNGAGKSTLLKILSRVTSPTTGSVKVKGRIASLLEVGTGFHPELTGRENIYLNGAILGMRKAEIKRKFDEIVDFAGVERYIDTPVKRYSSGMYVRLAFAVAAHLESEILIVDEVLAVGDAEFQKKCLGKMGDVSKGEGRTVLFVSHNMDSILSLCRNAILLKDGSFVNFSKTREIIKTYTDQNNRLVIEEQIKLLNKPQIKRVELDAAFLAKGHLKCNIEFESPFIIANPNIGLVMKSAIGSPIFGTNFRLHPGKNTQQEIQNGRAILEILSLPLHSGVYTISIYLGDEGQNYDQKLDYLTFELTAHTNQNHNYDINTIGPLQVDAKWNLLREI